MTTIKLKNGSGAPTSGDLVTAEPALDLTNKRLYTEDSGGTVIEVGTNPGTDVTFADNRKAIFGAGSDLQIYHDGNNSFIADVGTGNLGIRAENLFLQNADGSENYATATLNGAFTLSYDNSQKFATTSTGIDVTGTVVSNGLTLQNNAEYLKVTNSSGASTRAFGVNAANNLYIGGIDADIGPILFVDNGATLATLGPTGIDVTGTVTADGLTVQTATGSASPTPSKITIATSTSASDWSTTSPWGSLAFYSADASAGGAKEEVTLDVVSAQAAGGVADFRINTYNSGAKERFRISHDGDISFYEDTGTTAKLFWDASAESLGIGTSSPDAKLEIDGTANDELLRLTGAGSSFELHATSGNAATANTSMYRLALDYLSGTATNGFIDFYRGTAGNNGYLAFGSSGTERMRIDSSGNVGIGTSSPNRVLHVEGTRAVLGSTKAVLQLSDDTAMAAGVGGGLTFTGKSNTSQSDSNTIFAGIHGAKDNSTSGNFAGHMIFSTRANGANPAERMRIDSSGNLLVGKTSVSLGATGIEVKPSGEVRATASGAQALQLNRLSTGGTIVDFRQDSLTVGSIQTSGSATTYNTSSDQRLKENIVDAPSASDDIDAIQVRSFDWKADGSHQKYGMVAQELQTVAPEAVSGDADSDDMMGVDYSKLVPMMLKEIQSLRARVAQLEGAN